MNKERVQQSFTKTISQVLELSEAVFGGHEQWPFFRKVILNRLNDLRREVEAEVKERGGEDAGHRTHQK